MSAILKPIPSYAHYKKVIDNTNSKQISRSLIMQNLQLQLEEHTEVRRWVPKVRWWSQKLNGNQAIDKKKKWKQYLQAKKKEAKSNAV